jgi:AcrR family transcriptional regulator
MAESKSSMEVLNSDGVEGTDLRAPQQGNATFDRLLSTAAVLFRKKGYSETTTRELANLLGIQRSSLYHHISGKQDLLYLLSLASLRRIRKRVEEAVAKESDPGRKIAALMVAHLTTILENRDQHAAGLLELRSLVGPRHTEIVALRDSYETYIRQLIGDAQETGALREDIDPKHLTLMLLNMMNWSIIWYSPRNGVKPALFARDMVTVFMHGCLSPTAVDSTLAKR